MDRITAALRLAGSSEAVPAISLAGAGGKSSAAFQIARELCGDRIRSVFLTSTTHLGIWQAAEADRHLIPGDLLDLEGIADWQGVSLITGKFDGDRTKPVSDDILSWLHAKHDTDRVPLIIEADGSRMHPLKAPAAHEPVIPPWSRIVIVVAGLTGLGLPLSEDSVHRAQIFADLTGSAMHEPVQADALQRLLIHPLGGLKGIPVSARRIAFLNQADTPDLESIGGGMAAGLLGPYDSVLVGSILRGHYQTLERIAGIVLAAGASNRFGSPKQVLSWRGQPFVRRVARTALQAGLSPVLVVTGDHAAEVEAALADLPVRAVHNPDFAGGQSTSIRAGIRSLPEGCGGAVFLLADQPQIPAEVIRALVEAHSRSLSPILAPLVLEERRANPVLFDRSAFAPLTTLTGDVGGRALFDRYRVEFLPWHDESLLLDVDRPEDLDTLRSME